MKIEEMGDEFKELVQHSDSLQQENIALKREIAMLKQQLATKSPLVSLETSDEESICKVQLRILNDTSLTRPLTLDEARRVEIYTKILNGLKNKPHTVVVETKDMSEKELLAALQHGQDSESN